MGKGCREEPIDQHVGSREVLQFVLQGGLLVNPLRWSPDFGQDVKLIPTEGWD
jgi:hypothetical protein